MRHIVGGILAALAVAFLASGWMLAGSWSRKRKRCDANTSGVLVDMCPRRSPRGFPYCPVFEYTIDGQTYRLASRSGTSAPVPPGVPEKVVQIFYNPSDHADAYVAPGTDSAAVVWMFWGLGLMFLAAGTIFLSL